MIRPVFLSLLLCAVAEATVANPNAAVAAPVSDPSARCSSLESTDFSQILDAPTQITQAKLIPALGDSSAYCHVRGYVAPQVGFELRLPIENWNGKFLEVGCGGHCGDTSWTFWCHPERGYACLASDAGHTGSAFDALWGYGDLQAKVDWGYRAPHVAALAGKAITNIFYNKPAKRSYFMGCSTGGRQALQEAQRFPWDFDGIIAGAPPIDLSTLYVTFAWTIRVTHDAAGKPLLNKGDLKLITDAAVAKCDLDDGVRDGIISDPRRCPFDPAELTCKANQATGCLTLPQVEAVKKVYAGPTTSGGVKLSRGGPMPGSEYDRWNEQQGNWMLYLGAAGNPPLVEPLVSSGMRYLFFMPELGPAWQLSEFNFDRDYRRLGVMEPLYDSGNPDLRRFKAAGGKLLAYQGTNDSGVLPQITEDYYDTTERTMGGREATQSFFRLFVLPGVDHCAGGVGADAVDYLFALESWVERGQAPDRLIAAHLKTPHPLSDPPAFPLDPAEISFTRPVYPYPIAAKYKGHGDPNDAANFGPVMR